MELNRGAMAGCEQRGKRPDRGIVAECHVPGVERPAEPPAWTPPPVISSRVIHALYFPLVPAASAGRPLRSTCLRNVAAISAIPIAGECGSEGQEGTEVDAFALEPQVEPAVGSRRQLPQTIRYKNFDNSRGTAAIILAISGNGCRTSQHRQELGIALVIRRSMPRR